MESKLVSHVLKRQFRRTTFLQAAITFGLVAGAHANNHDNGTNSIVPLSGGNMAIATALQQAPQAQTISGKVSDERGEPLPGVTVLVKGSTNATITDADGVYSLTVPNLTSTLVFSFLGYGAQEVEINSRATINVNLKPSDNQLEEVVVVGYGEQKRANVLGAVATITPKEVEDIPAANLSTLLQGRLAGVSIGQSSGRPGASTGLSIRTNPSYGTAQQPLYVIDGFIRDQAAFEILDPTEVESISVLKDASAAVYGARGSNGVVLVTTKRGREGKAKISYSGSYGLATPRQMTDMLSAYDHATLLNNKLRITNPTNYASQPGWYTEDELEHFKTVNHNWLDESFKSAPTHRHTLNISGGSDKVRYFAGGSFYDEKGNLEGTQFKKYTIRVGLDANITNNLVASFKLSSDNNWDRRPIVSQDGSNYNAMNSTFQTLLQTPRWVPSYINGLPVGQNGIVSQHPLAVNDINSYGLNEGDNTVINAGLEYTVPFIDGLKLRGSYNQSRRSGTGKSYQVNYDLYNFKTAGGNNHIITDELDENNPTRTINNGERLSMSNNSDKNYQLNASIAYDKTIGRHDISAMVLYEQAESESSNFNTYRNIITVPEFEQFGGLSADQIFNSSGSGQNGRLSYVGRLNYGYASKYLLEASFRYEGSVKFPPETRWGLFPAVALGWRISEESFFKDNVSFMNNLKLRFSGGIMGNDTNIPDMQWVRSFSTTSGAYLGGTGLTNAIQNRNEGMALTGQTWEKSAAYNAGLEMGFTNNIRIELDAYYRYTWDILTNRGSTLPASAGINRPPSENFGKMSARGIDASIGYDGTIGRNFGYNIGLNTHWGKSKVIDIFQNPMAYGAWDDQIGKMPNGETGLIALGILRTQEEVDALLESNPNLTIFGRVPEVGMINYQDMGGPNRSNEPDGIIDSNDRRIIAPAVNALNFGINLGISYKSFRLSTNLGMGGFGTYVFYDQEAYRAPTATLNGPSFWRDHWTPENPNAAYPSPAFSQNEQRSTFWMRDGLFLNLNMINASYSVPQSLSSKIGLPDVRVFFSGRNMYSFINPYKYKDPSLSRFNSYPMVRTFNFGLNVTI
ncbi:TonB-dependent receptor [Pontibacter sp. 13R65]|uniref:SusC/RagA family TonB-linked outer membrane protein n=1 Tax=Pontibacter sp. 13R65 TaxID=3127458 RepID=UPI00301C9E8D